MDVRNFPGRSILLATCMTLMTAVVAQQRFELRTGAGFGSAYYLAREFSDGGDFFNWDDTRLSVTKYELPLYVECSFYLNTKMFVGVAGTWNRFEFLNSYTYKEDQITRKYKQATLTLLFRYYYPKKKSASWQIYSSGNLGLSIKHLHTVEYIPSQRTYLEDRSLIADNALHFNPIGISFGKRLGAYAEAGFGCKGIIHGGIYFRP